MKNLNTFSYSILWLVAMLTVTIHVKANYYCDPATGSMSNPGTDISPWSTLEDVFDAGKTFNPGDTIFLRDGYHGSVSILDNNSNYVTIQAQGGHSPTARNISFQNASYWILSGITISPEVVGEYPGYASHSGIVKINSDCNYITIQNCLIFCAEEVAEWDEGTVAARFGTGIYCNSPNCQAINNYINNTRYPICTGHNATAMVIRDNLFENIGEDGVRCLGNYMVIENNVLRNWYGLTGDHDDGFQSWTGGYDSEHPVGSETKYGGIIRGNVIISTLPGNPFPPTYGTQGIGWFDGMFEDYVIENNLICTKSNHGITIYGATNCKIINNTVVENPYDLLDYRPSIKIFPHKPGGPYANAPSTGNIIRNNISPSIDINGNVGEVDHNLITTNYTDHFVDYDGLNFHLKLTSTAIGAGILTDAPLKDLEGNDRNVSFDLGCYEYIGEIPIPVTGVSVSPVTLSLDEGQTSNLSETVSPANASIPFVIWSSNNTSIATVDASGLITAISEGFCTITATTNDGGYTTECYVTVYPLGDPLTALTETCGIGTASTINGYSGWDNAGSITYAGYNTTPGFNKVHNAIPSSGYADASGGSYVVIAPGYTETAWFTIDGINTLGMSNIELNFGIYFHSVTANHYLKVSYSTDGINWTMLQNSNNFPATETWGRMTYAGLPSVPNLKIKFEELMRKAVYFDDISIEGTVSNIRVTSVSVSPSTLSLNEGGASDLTETVSPSDATVPSVFWSSSNTSIATVDENGLVSALSEGICTITVTTNDGRYIDDCDLIVNGSGSSAAGFVETCGTGTASTINAYSGWDNVGSITYTGYNTNPGFNKVEAVIPSSGYTGASGGSYVRIAPGFTETAWFIIDGINTLGMTDVELSFGIYFHSITAKNYLEVSYSTDGTNWTIIQNSNSFPVIETWGLMKYTGLPAVSNLRIKFEELYRKSVYFDDISVSENTRKRFHASKLSLSNTDVLLNAYPNPIIGKILNIELSGIEREGEAIFRLVDITGRIVSTIQKQLICDPQLIELPLGNVKPGSYFLYVLHDNDNYTRTIIVK